jgi:hypothetical protein
MNFLLYLLGLLLLLLIPLGWVIFLFNFLSLSELKLNNWLDLLLLFLLLWLLLGDGVELGK